MISRLYLATSPKVHEHILDGEVRFLGSRTECVQVIGVLGQALPDGRVHEVRDAMVGLSRLDSQGLWSGGDEATGGTLEAGLGAMVRHWGMEGNQDRAQ